MEIILEILAELVLQFVFEGLADLGLHKSRKGKRTNPVLAGVGYLVFGAVLGGISLLVFPGSFIQSEGLKLANLFGTPLILGGIMSVIGNVRNRKGKETVRIEKFSYGFLFAFGLALVRFLFAA